MIAYAYLGPSSGGALDSVADGFVKAASSYGNLIGQVRPDLAKQHGSAGSLITDQLFPPDFLTAWIRHARRCPRP